MKVLVAQTGLDLCSLDRAVQGFVELLEEIGLKLL